MIELRRGNLFECPAEALVNTVNTVGVMGKGIALQFKQAFPEMFKAYAKACRAGQVSIGRMHVVEVGGLMSMPRWIINFPTKEHWRSPSRLEDISAGLEDLVSTIRRLGITSIALPPLGCGLGGLAWKEVRPLIETAMARIQNITIYLFEPAGAPAPESMPNRTVQPLMTPGRAALLTLMDRYLKGSLDQFISLLEIHKLLYFLQASGEHLRLRFQRGVYGPYAANLRHVLTRLENHYLRGYGDGQDAPQKPITLLPGAAEDAKVLLAGYPEIQTRMGEVERLIDGFEDPYGLELLSTVHWIMTTHPEFAHDPDKVVNEAQNWNSRKKRLMKPTHLLKAWQRLTDQHWETRTSTGLPPGASPATKTA